MDLETAVCLVFEGQLGIIVDSKEEAQTLVSIAKSFGFTRRSTNYDGIPERWCVFGHYEIAGVKEKEIVFYSMRSSFAQTRDLVSFSDLATVAFDTSSICDLL
jgi:hypothetical protein